MRLLTDPLLTARVAHLRRRVPLPDAMAADVVLISHLHPDHLHLRSLAQVAAGTRLVVPRGAARLVARMAAAEIVEVAPGDEVALAGRAGGSVRLEVTGAAHGCRRGPHSRAQAEPVGYVVDAGGLRVYFAGDTDLFPAMRDLRPIEVALLPIWGWGPTLGDGHLDPAGAARATGWIDPRFVVPIHWGTYSPVRFRSGPPPWLDTPLGAFRQALTERGLERRLRALRPGAALDVTPHGPS